MAAGGCLRACYAMSGTDLAYGTVCLRVCYAISGTDLAHAAICLSRMMLSGYARSRQCPVLTYSIWGASDHGQLHSQCHRRRAATRGRDVTLRYPSAGHPLVAAYCISRSGCVSDIA
eukprot:2839784-Rhodomonas_salina.2